MENQQKTIKQQPACDAAFLLNEAIRELTIPQQVMTLFAKNHTSESYAGALIRMVMASTIIGVYRVYETRKHFLVPWLFSDDELEQLGLLDIEHFVRDRGAFDTIRSQWAAHAQSKASTATSPGRLIEPSALGRALERTGIGNEEKFLARIRNDLIPAVERVRDRILESYPEARQFITTKYAEAVQQGAIDEERNKAAAK